MIYIENEQNFLELYEILKKFCVLSNFASDYEILEILGKGYFAEVHSVQSLSSKKKMAAKIFEKDTENFKKNAVDYIYMFN